MTPSNFYRSPGWIQIPARLAAGLLLDSGLQMRYFSANESALNHSNPDAIERLAPILMTALVTGLGLLPLALGSGAPGREIEGPMAIVILGGLFTLTTLNLLILPALALRYGRFRARS